MKKFSSFRFFILLSIIGIFSFISFLCAFGKDEGTLGTNLILNFFAACFYVFRFPSHVLFGDDMKGGVFFLGLIVNVVLYAFIVELFISNCNAKNKKGVTKVTP